MLNEGSPDYGVQQHIKWLRGAFEALEKQYLKSIIYTVYTDNSNPNGSIIEMYKISITYAEMVVEDETLNGSNKTNKSSFFMPTFNLEEIKGKF